MRSSEEPAQVARRHASDVGGNDDEGVRQGWEIVAEDRV
jgi:hypothetical protein